MSPRAKYLEWRRQPAVGCMFARIIAIRPTAYKQVVESIAPAITPAKSAEQIAKRVETLVEDKSAVAAALLFPDIATLEGMARIMLALGDQPKWTVTAVALENEVVTNTTALRVVRDIPFGQTSCPSETLVLGPFNEFPATRRAPVPALEIFVGEPQPLDPKTGKPTTQANLAHIDTQKILGNHGFDHVWKKSVQGRKEKLGGVNDIRAKAKVTLAIPTSLARSLGCAP